MMRDDNIEALEKYDSNLSDAINSLASAGKFMAIFAQDHDSDRLEYTLRRINEFLKLFNLKIAETIDDYKDDLKKSLTEEEYKELEILEKEALVIDEE